MASKKAKQQKIFKSFTPKDIENLFLNAKIFSLTLVLFLLSMVVLLGTPKVMVYAQKGIGLINPQMVPTQSSSLVGQVAGIERKPVVEISSTGVTPPSFSAAAVLAQDLTSGQILFQKNIHQRLLPASTTKLMTALVAVNYYKPTDVLTVLPEDLVQGSNMGLVLGEKISFKNILYGMLLNSGNDAAMTIASNYPGGMGAFVAAMNQKAQELGLADTHFQNPVGFDDPMQYSSAFDLAKLATVAVSDPAIAKVVDTKDMVVTSTDGSKEHDLKNLDELLGKNGVIGIKTGYTDGAGENFVGLVNRDGHKVLTVVLDSVNRFGETSNLMNWVYQNFTWKEVFADSN